MSDDTLYLRGKLAERGSRSAHFTRDGFDYWAESEAPARVGQVQKVPAEPTKAMEGDALARLYARHAKRHSKKMEGGARAIGGAMCEELDGDALKVLGLTIPTTLTEAKQFAKDNPILLRTLYDKVKSSSTLKKFVPAAIWDFVELWASGEGYMGDGTRKGQRRKTARRAYMPRYAEEELEGDALKILGLTIPTTLTEAKQFAKDNPIVLRTVYDKLKSSSTLKKYVPAAIWDFMELWASGQGYMGAGTRKGMARKTARPAYMPAEEEFEGGFSTMSHALATRYSPRDEMKPRGSAKPRAARKPSARAMLVKQVMAEHGLSLPAASKYVKEHGLY